MQTIGNYTFMRKEAEQIARSTNYKSYYPFTNFLLIMHYTIGKKKI
ncbi:MAG: hypothetical protein LHW48_09430 [Candidatus Cloacimonetes bacterium]|nr:hypothetical protein [Candidatus Cloacimonadota bacterium]